MNETVRSRAHRDLIELPHRTRVDDALARLQRNEQWVVVLNNDGTAVGVATTAELRAHQPSTLLGKAAEHLPPLVVAAATAAATAAVQTKALQSVRPHQPVLVEHEGQVVGVWAGQDLAETRIGYGTLRSDAELFGQVRIAWIRRQCGYRERGIACLAVQEFPELPNKPPPCDNPTGMAPHRFAW